MLILSEINPSLEILLDITNNYNIYENGSESDLNDIVVIYDQTNINDNVDIIAGNNANKINIKRYLKFK